MGIFSRYVASFSSLILLEEAWFSTIFRNLFILSKKIIKKKKDSKSFVNFSCIATSKDDVEDQIEDFWGFFIVRKNLKTPENGINSDTAVFS